jgi:hypothetical protein
MCTIFCPLCSIIANSNTLAVWLYSYVLLYTNIFEMKNLFEKLQKTENMNKAQEKCTKLCQYRIKLDALRCI